VPERPDPKAFTVKRSEVRNGVSLAYVHEGVGGAPIVLIHGYPETKRIWWRNIAPLAAAGFEVIVPDLRGFGDSDLAPDEHYDVAASAHDIHALLTEVLGHDRCAACGGDFGGVVVQDLGLRFPGVVERQCLFNTIPPVLERWDPPPEVRQATDYFVRQGRDADALAAELRTPDERRRYIAQFYGPRFWAAPGTFTREDVDFMTEPFADADRLRAGFGNYESGMRNRPLSEAPRFFELNPVPTLVLYGPDDHVIWREFPAMAEVVFTERVGPFVVPGAGHFLQWERAELLNQALAYFFRDLLE
jgi:pimeloyl-ACP methyl ester carboxylesterase